MKQYSLLTLIVIIMNSITSSNSTLVFCKENTIESHDLKSYYKPYCCVKENCRNTGFANRIFESEMHMFKLSKKDFPESRTKQYEPVLCGGSLVTKMLLDIDISIEDYIELYRTPENIPSTAPDTHFRRSYDCAGVYTICEAYHTSNFLSSDHLKVQCTTGESDFINKIYSIRDGYLIIDSKSGDSLSYPNSKNIKYSRIMKEILSDRCKDSFNHKKLFSKFNQVIKKLNPNNKPKEDATALSPVNGPEGNEIDLNNKLIEVCDNQGMLEELIIKTMSDRDMCGKLALNNQKPTADEKKLNDFLLISFGVSSIIKGLPVASNVANIITGISRIVIGLSNLIEDYYEKPESAGELSDNISIELMDQIISFNYNLRQTCQAPISINMPTISNAKDSKPPKMEAPRMIANTILELFKYVKAK